MPLGVFDASCGTNGTHIFVFGGRDSETGPPTATVQIFNPEGLKWQTSVTNDSISRLPSAVSSAGRAVFAHDAFIILGGVVSTGL